MIELHEDAAFAAAAQELGTLAQSGEKIALATVTVACMALGRAYALCSTPDKGSNVSRTLTVTKTQIADKLSALGAGKASTFQAYLGLADTLCGFSGRGKARAARYPDLHIAAIEGRRNDLERGIAAIGRSVRDLRDALRPKATGEAAKERDAAKAASRRALRVATAIGEMTSVEEIVAAIKAALEEAGETRVKITLAKAKA